MIFKRKIYKSLQDWKEISNGSSAMLIEGARRVGKSTIANEFGKQEYRSCMLIDFSKVNEDFKRNFLDLRLDLDGLFLYLQAATGVTLYKRESLIIFDEVQCFVQAREFIKHLVADGRYDYLETGSLVTLKTKAGKILLPSEEESLSMNPMDFEEFLWSMGQEPLASFIHSSFESLEALPDDLHRKAGRFWREYMLIGGMPQPVAAYLPERDMTTADHQKRMILKLYRDDIEKDGGISAKKIKTVFDSIPGQLSKHEKKLIYTQIDSGSRSRDFMLAFAWMADAAIANLCTLCVDPSIGLSLTEDDTAVKCYLNDTGLLSTMAFSTSSKEMPQAYRDVLLGNAAVNEGMLMENAIAQQLVCSGHQLHFYSKKSNVTAERMEIDFLVVKPYKNAAGKLRVSPIEVKSGKRYSPVSLDKFKAKFGNRVGAEYVLHPKQLKVQGERIFLPLYMSFCL